MPRPGPPQRPSKYQPIADFLAMQEADIVTLSFTRIAALVGRPLPVTAYVNTSFWRANERAAVRALHAAGWEAVRVNRFAEAVVFQRVAQE